jgi:hypothetical protein
MNRFSRFFWAFFNRRAGKFDWEQIAGYYCALGKMRGENAGQPDLPYFIVRYLVAECALE